MKCINTINRKGAEFVGVSVCVGLALSAGIGGLLHGKIEVGEVTRQCVLRSRERVYFIEIPLACVSLFCVLPLLHGALHLDGINKFHRGVSSFRTSKASISSRQSDIVGRNTPSLPRTGTAFKPQILSNNQPKMKLSKFSKADRNLHRLSQTLALYLAAIFTFFVVEIVVLVTNEVTSSDRKVDIAMEELFIKCHIIKSKDPSLDCETYNADILSDTQMALYFVRSIGWIASNLIVSSWAFRRQHWQESLFVSWVHRLYRGEGGKLRASSDFDQTFNSRHGPAKAVTTTATMSEMIETSFISPEANSCYFNPDE